MNYPEIKVVAEIGAVHVGSMDRAKHLIKLAALCGADYVKLQKRNPPDCIPLELQDKPHPNTLFAYGDTYLAHRMALELNAEQHRELKEYCESISIGYATSIWDVQSAREIISLDPDYIKLPSACNMRRDLIEILAWEYSGEIHISTGMIAPGERVDLAMMLSELGILNRTVLYHCTSEYPCPFERLYLLEIENLKKIGVKAVGFSNHGFGIAADIVGYMLGAEWLERHFVDDRTFHHTDASASLEPDGLRRLCRDLKAVRKALYYKKNISQGEAEQRQKLRMNDDKTFSV